jgi:hypothetical protein
LNVDAVMIFTKEGHEPLSFRSRLACVHARRDQGNPHIFVKAKMGDMIGMCPTLMKGVVMWDFVTLKL